MPAVYIIFSKLFTMHIYNDNKIELLLFHNANYMKTPDLPNIKIDNSHYLLAKQVEILDIKIKQQIDKYKKQAFIKNVNSPDKQTMQFIYENLII